MPDRVERAKNLFYLLQTVVGTGFVVWLIYLRTRGPDSGFRVREADVYKPEGPKFPAAQPLPGTPPGPAKDAATKARPKARPLSLPGIRIDGAPHEILGISPQASDKEIQKAYRDLIKRYHPDVVGRPGTREWEDAQEIAEAVNRAKEEMLTRSSRRKS